ncbi:peptide chain release factor 3, partial [Croceibacter atlanticus]|nr:peptide chain release factor 3 [Croceibacter atlanticus]
KLDREARDPFELLDEIEKTLALDVAPVTWPIGTGRNFSGTYELGGNRVRRLDAAEDAGMVPVSGPGDTLFDELLTEDGAADAW